MYGNADIDGATRRVARAIRLSARVATPRALVDGSYPGITERSLMARGAGQSRGASRGTS
jgi:hypothetical protein